MAWLAAMDKLGSGAKVVEVGVERGINACECIAKWEGIDLTLVDSYKGNEVKPPTNGFTAELNRRGVKWMLMDSCDAAKLFDDESLDFVYIDADHSYEAVMKDIMAWASKVRHGGVLGGHDYSEPSCGGVKRAVDEIFGDKVNFDTRVEGFQTDWWVFK